MDEVTIEKYVELCNNNSVWLPWLFYKKTNDPKWGCQ